MKRVKIASLLLLSATALAPVAAAMTDEEMESVRVVLQGHDPVAYFTAGRPIKGMAQFRFDWDGGRYLFASARHRDLFAANPERYAPQFAGLCTGAVIRGQRLEADPQAWAIVDGRLYLHKTHKGIDDLKKDPAVAVRAQQAWQSAK
jgi:YHS domain-containing protein